MSAELTQISKLMNRPDPLLSFKWVSPVLPFNLSSDYLESIDLPFNNIQVNDAMYTGSSYRYYPGSHDVSAFNASFYMDSKALSLKWILGWKARVKNFETGAYSLPKDYKSSWKVQLLDTGNAKVAEWELSGVWPSETSAFSLNYTDNGRLILTQSFSIDDVSIS